MTDLQEALKIHPELHQHLDSDMNVNYKHKYMAKLLKTLLHNGQETGLQDAKPKKGSSRAVYFPSEPDDIHIDGQPAKMNSVLKIAFPGALDKYNYSGSLLGEHQNMEEGDYWKQKSYGVLTPVTGKHMHFEHNPEGILAPVIHSHDEGHYLHMGQISPVTAQEFKEATKTDDFPKGITHQEFFDAVNHEYQKSQGKKHYGRTSEERIEQLQEHPLVHNTTNFIFDTRTHPGDFNKRNMGIWTHPVTGNKQVVLADYGFNESVADEYAKARKKKYEANRRY